jgi:hypothetical protein
MKPGSTPEASSLGWLCLSHGGQLRSACFCGFSLGEVAKLRGVSERTFQRDWRKARLLLHRVLQA